MAPIWTLGTLGMLGTFGMFETLWMLVRLGSLWTLWMFGTLGSLCTLGKLGMFGRLGSLGTHGTPGRHGSLGMLGRPGTNGTLGGDSAGATSGRALGGETSFDSFGADCGEGDASVSVLQWHSCIKTGTDGSLSTGNGSPRWRVSRGCQLGPPRKKMATAAVAKNRMFDFLFERHNIRSSYIIILL